jgi:hypothetical protein
VAEAQASQRERGGQSKVMREARLHRRQEAPELVGEKIVGLFAVLGHGEANTAAGIPAQIEVDDGILHPVVQVDTALPPCQFDLTLHAR